MNENLILLGRITKTHGYSGGLVFVLETFKTDLLQDFEWIFVERHGEKVPFKVVSRRDVDNAKMIISLKGIDKEELARNFSNSDFYLPDTQIDLEPTDEIMLSGLEGWKLFQSNQYLGEVIEVIENKAQTLLSVKGEEKEFLIPFVEEFVVDISSDSKSIIMDIPDGLIDL